MKLFWETEIKNAPYKLENHPITLVQTFTKGHYYLVRVGPPRRATIEVVRWMGEYTDGDRPLFINVEPLGTVGDADVLVFADLGKEQPLGDQG